MFGFTIVWLVGMHLAPKFIIKIHFNEENKLATLRYHLVIFGGGGGGGFLYNRFFTVKVGHL